MTPGAQFARGAVVAFALHVTAMGLAFALQLAFARWMPQATFGVYAQVTAAAFVAANLLVLGVPFLNLQQLPTLLSTGDHARWRGLMRWALVRAGGAGLGVGVAWLGVGLALGLDPAWTLGGLLLPTLVVIGVQQSQALGFKDVVLARAPSEVGRPLLTLAGVAAVVALGHTPTAAHGLAAACVAGLLVTGFLAWRLHALTPPEARTVTPVVDPSWGPIANQFLGANFFAIVMDRADILVVGWLAGAESVAVYAVITSLGKLLLFALGAVNTILAPMVSDLHAAGKPDEVRGLLRTGVAAATVLAIAGTAFFGLFTEPVLALFGEGYGVGVVALYALLPGYFANAACGSAGLVVSMTGHQHITWRVIAGAGVLMLVLDLALIPGWGIVGAAVARSVAMIAWNLALATWARVQLDYDPALTNWLR